MKRICLLIAFIAVYVLPVSSESHRPDPFQDPFYQSIHTRHQKAVDGDKKEVPLLIQELERITQQRPYDSLLLAYLGSSYTLLSRDTFPGPKKMEYLKKGGKTLDAAVNQEPLNSATRFIRAVNYYQLPALFNKKSTAREDFKILVQQIEDPQSHQSLNDDTRQAIYYYAGLSYMQMKQPEEARSTWNKGLKISELSPLAEMIKKEIARLKPDKKSS